MTTRTRTLFAAIALAAIALPALASSTALGYYRAAGVVEAVEVYYPGAQLRGSSREPVVYVVVGQLSGGFRAHCNDPALCLALPLGSAVEVHGAILDEDARTADRIIPAAPAP